VSVKLALKVACWGSSLYGLSSAYRSGGVRVMVNGDESRDQNAEVKEGTVRTSDSKASAIRPFENRRVLEWQAMFNAPPRRPPLWFPSIALGGRRLTEESSALVNV